MSEKAVVVLIIAPFVGSFAGALVRRLPMEHPQLWERSCCESCGTKLKPRELIPLLSYALQRGRCRHCQAAISAFHPLIELAALAVAALAVTIGAPETLVADCVLGWTLLTLAWIDIRTLLLPDILTLPLLLAGLGEAWLNDPDALFDRAMGAAIGWAGFVGLAWLWRRLRGIDALGQGDAKLLAVGGAWLGWAALPNVLLIAASCGLVGALIGGRGRVSTTQVLAFGPWLALAIWLLRLNPLN